MKEQIHLLTIGSAPMRTMKPKDTGESLENYPPRFASEAVPHRIEQEVQRVLLAHPSLRFSSLVIRRLGNGVCLQGVLEVDGESPDVCAVAQRVAGVEKVLNHLVITSRGCHVPPKG